MRTAPHISALENVELPMLFGGMTVPKRRKRAAELLDRVGLALTCPHVPGRIPRLEGLAARHRRIP